MSRVDEDFVDSASAVVGVAIPAENRPGVIAQIRRLASLADLVMDFPAAEDEKPITILRHD